MKVNVFTTIVWWLLLVILCLTPLVNINELQLMQGGQIYNLTSFVGSFAVKALKDASLFIVILILMAAFVSGYATMSYLFPLFLLCILPSIFLSYPYNGLVVTLLGLRWILPIALLFFTIRFEDVEKKKKQLFVLFMFLMILNLIFQIYQLAVFPSWYGKNFLGLPARVSGLFLVPNTAAFFVNMIFSVVIFYIKEKSLVGNISKLEELLFFMSFIVAATSLFLIQSGTGVVCFFVLSSIYLFRYSKYKFCWLVICIIFMFFLIISIDYIVQREGFLMISGGERIQVFIDIYKKSNFVSDSFGLFTNTAVLYASRFAADLDAVIADSLYSSVIGNLGLIGALALSVVLLRLVFIYRLCRNITVFALLSVYFVFSLSTIYTEAFPMNYFLFGFLWLFGGQRSVAG